MLHLTPPTPPLPLELCHLIIDILGALREKRIGRVNPQVDIALKSCTLVCRGWRYRAQRWLLCQVRLDDVDSLCRLARVFQATPDPLLPTVRYVRLIFPLDDKYPTENILSRLPTVFRPGTSSLREVRLCRRDVTGDTKNHTLPYLPLRPRTTSLLAKTFSSVTDLQVMDMDFSNFSAFGIFLDCFPKLEGLTCNGVRWSTLGVLPGCMTRSSGRTFLGHLSYFGVYFFTVSVVHTAHTYLY